MLAAIHKTISLQSGNADNTMKTRGNLTNGASNGVSIAAAGSSNGNGGVATAELNGIGKRSSARPRSTSESETLVNGTAKGPMSPRSTRASKNLRSSGDCDDEVSFK